MTPTNPLASFLSWSPETDETEDRRLKDFMNGSTAAAAPAAEKPKDDDMDVLQNSLRGWISQAAPTGEMPSREDFDKRWRQNMSPAREFLANFMQGFSDSLAGRQFRDIKSKEWEREREIVAEKQRSQQIKQQFAMGMAQLIDGQIRQKRDLEMRSEFERLKNDQARETNAMKNQISYLEFMRKYNVDQRTQARLDAQWEWKKKREQMSAADPYLQQGILRAEAEFKAKGLDPDDPKYMDALLSAATDYSHAEFAYREKTKADNRPAKAPTTDPGVKAIKDLAPSRVTITNGWGEQEYGYQSPVSAIRTGNPWVHKPDWWTDQGVRDFPVAEQTALMKTQQAVDTVRMALHTLAKNPSATGIKQLLPLSMQGYARDISPSERSLVQLFNMGISKYFLGESGVAISGHEEQRLGKGLAPFWDKPENFFIGAMTFASAHEAMLARSRAGIDPNELNMADVLDDYLTWAQKEIQAGRKPVVPSGQQMMEMAAKAKKKELIYDNKGRIRGLKK